MEQLTNLLDKSYDAKRVEAYWYPKWNQAGLFGAKAEDSLPEHGSVQKPYVVMMPPPNVTGSLHNGHALFVTLQDILCRYHRMLGENVLWLPGIDHAGIATQAVVERELKRLENKTRHDLGRKEFLKRVWAWKEKHGSRILQQLELMGASADWTRLRFTMDEQCSRAVKEAFVRLWNEGLIFRGERLVNWDPGSHTALSDEEIEHITRETELWSFAYKLKDDPSQEIVIATTRPETMLGDTGVAVNPNDDRYRHLVGKALAHPFFPDRDLRVVADDHVDPEFGTGAVKITPGHDHNDFQIAERHNLEKINLYTLEMNLNENAGPYQGLDRAAARERVKSDLTALGLFRGVQKHEHAVGVSQRSGEIIEPLLSRQYFVRAKPLAEKAYQAVASGETKIIPENWRKTWDHFLLNIRDWCVSRQLWWGHQIPVFYDMDKVRPLMAGRGLSDAEMLQVALRELDDETVRGFSEASLENLAELNPHRYLQEGDVLDTWFSAGLWPFSTLGWPDNTEDLRAFYPGAVLETGFDILFFWVARMMMMGVHFMGKAPFADVYLHAMVRDAHGRKMSKSLGNAIDPIDVIDGITLGELIAKIKTYPVPQSHLPKVLEGIKKDFPEGIPASGADGLRFSLAVLSGQGRDVKLSIPRVSGYRAFLNKIWNATRFSLMRVGPEPVQVIADVKHTLLPEDKWILSRLQQTVQKVRSSLTDYRFSEAADQIYQLFWSEFCDWYIEFAKLRLAPEADGQSREAARAVLIELLDTSMRLLHPFCPFISEEIWQKLPTRFGAPGEFCCTAPYPEYDASLVDPDAERDVTLVQEAIVMIRNARQESNLPAQKKVPAIILVDHPDHLRLLQNFSAQIQFLALTQDLQIAKRGTVDVPKNVAVNSHAHMDVVVPLEGLIDLGAERQRLEKELQKLEREHAGLEGRLNNASFVEKAPPEVVSQSRELLILLEQKKANLLQAIKQIG